MLPAAGRRAMKTVVSLASNSLERVASLAAERLEAGGLVALPTDTVYGLACLVQHGEAVDRTSQSTSIASQTRRKFRTIKAVFY